MSDSYGAPAGTYLNPVYNRSFPDPFVFKFGGEYFAYCTGFAPDGNVFSVLRSSDLVTWSEVGSAMLPLHNSPPFYWAPEVTHDNGKFYLYYSVGNETLMELRVAVSDRPDGAFIDSGVSLTSEDFAIDAHVFVDTDGQRYLFYATDFLEHTHIGTGTVVDRMINWFELEGNPRPVTRAMYDWQVYDPIRKEKGGVRWHTVEGPAVMKRKGRYYEMFSGGNWQNTSYGVSFAVTDSIDRPDEWLQFSDGENVLPILRTLPELVVGPGHNCIVRGPNNRELYCVYHRWIDDARVMAVDRMDFAGDRIFVSGASHTPQPLPFEPRIKERFRGARLSPGLSATGSWRSTGESMISHSNERCEIRIDACPESFLAEISWNLSDVSAEHVPFGLTFDTQNGRMTFSLDPATNRASLARPGGDGKAIHIRDLPADFVWTALHLFRVEVDHRKVKINLDGAMVDLDIYLDQPVTGLSIFSDRQSIAMTSLDLTEGFEELFTDEAGLTENGWIVDTDGTYLVAGGELIFGTANGYLLRKGGEMESLEIAANFRTLEEVGLAGRFGLVLWTDGRETLKLGIDCAESTIVISNESDHTHPIPDVVQLSTYHQLRIIKLRETVHCYFDDLFIGEFAAGHRSSAGIFCDDARVAIEMVRLTAV